MPVQFKDYYETLGVPRTASEADIKKAFRKLAREHHPDMAKARDKAAAEAKFKEINEAYEVLSDPEKRKKYDELGADWDKAGGFQPPPGWQGGGGAQTGEFHFGGTGFSDFFEQFFGGMSGGRGSRPFGGTGFGRGFEEQAFSQRGHDVEADIMVTIDEALHGSKRPISLRREGSDKVETYNVRIPAGVHEGQRIRLAGRGGAGAGGAGDLYLRVKFQQHPDFRVEGADLVHELSLKPWQAVLGAEVHVPTLDGSVRLKVPAGTQNGQRFRVKQRGLPKAGGSRGDLYVAVEIEVPKMVSEEERKLWEQLAELGR